jgi:hypothetical protein
MVRVALIYEPESGRQLMLALVADGSTLRLVATQALREAVEKALAFGEADAVLGRLQNEEPRD